MVGPQEAVQSTKLKKIINTLRILDFITVKNGDTKQPVKPWLSWSLLFVSTLYTVSLFLLTGLSLWLFLALIVFLPFLYSLLGYRNGHVALTGIIIFFLIFFLFATVLQLLGVSAEDTVTTQKY